MIKLELTKDEYELVNEALETQIERLKQMTFDERIAWYNNSLFSKPINFQKQIDNTVYSVSTHFDVNASESIKDKIVRILELKE